MRADKVKEHKRNKNKPIIILVILLIIIAATVIVVQAGIFSKTIKDDEEVVNAAEIVNNAVDGINPLTGLKLNDDHLPRPVMVSTDNDSYLSRPQSGIGEADMVYELPIEGGGSRFEMVFYSQLPSKLGPARSARPYIVRLAEELDAVFVHNGWSPQAKALLQTGVIDNIAAIEHWDAFYRTTDRNIPHNCYADSEKVEEVAESLGYWDPVEVRSFKFLSGDSEVSGNTAESVNVNYVAEKNQYAYDEELGQYKRFTGGEEFIDLETQEQIVVSNIILQKVGIEVLDDEGRLAIDLLAGGQGKLFTQGKIQDITWSKDSYEDRTIFKDLSGNEIELTPGVTYIHLVDYTCNEDYSDGNTTTTIEW